MLWGADLSLNHGAVIELQEDGSLEWARYVIDTAKGAAGYAWGHGVSIPMKEWRKVSLDYARMARLAWWAAVLSEWFAERDPLYVSIEDYADGAKSNAVYEIGEQGGIYRWLAWESHAALRLYDNGSVKKFAVHHGWAEADEVVGAVAERWWPAVREVASPQARQDLAAAFSVARLYWTEMQLRSGRMALEALHPKEIEIFNRVTKAHPTNLLSRDPLIKTNDCPPGARSLPSFVIGALQNG